MILSRKGWVHVAFYLLCSLYRHPARCFEVPSANITDVVLYDRTA
jgi:hypothetical protein